MINYQNIHNSTLYYESEGFQRIEAPWTVSKYIEELTKPNRVVETFQLKHNDKCLVASGEQSFLYLYLKDFLPKGKFQTVTPCFRFETFDNLHSKYFIKNELIQTDIVNTHELLEMVRTAQKFFQGFFKQELQRVHTEEGYDIEIDGHELGSYGIRECEFLRWIYGTGCAEPRLSSLIKNYGISQK